MTRIIFFSSMNEQLLERLFYANFSPVTANQVDRAITGIQRDGVRRYQSQHVFSSAVMVAALAESNGFFRFTLFRTFSTYLCWLNRNGVPEEARWVDRNNLTEEELSALAFDYAVEHLHRAGWIAYLMPDYGVLAFAPPPHASAA